MIRCVKRLACLFFLLITTASLHAQVRVMTLAEALRLADANSPQLLEAKLLSRIPDLEKDEIQTGAKPQLGYKGNVMYAPLTTWFGYDPALTNEGQIGAQVTLDQSLYDGGARDIKLRANALEHERAIISTLRTQKDVALAVTQAFSVLYRSELEVALDTGSLTELRGYGDLVEKLHAGAGTGTTDLLKVRIQVAQEEATLRSAEDDRAIASETLAELTGLGPTTEIRALVLDDSLIDQARRLLRTERDSLGIVSIGKSPDIRLAELDLKTAETEVALSEAERKPTVSLNADAGLLNSFQNLQLPASERSPFWGASVGVTITGPLLDWGANKLQTEQKQLQHDALNYELQLKERGERADRARAMYTLQHSLERLDSLQETLQLAQNVYLLTRARYAGAQAAAFDVIDAHRQSLDLKRARFQLLNDIAQAIATLERLRGE